jgi:beta-phosphoglucomutase
MEQISACLFDLDGVIVETDKYHFLAWSVLAKELDIPFDQNDNERLKGVSRMASLDIVLGLGHISMNTYQKSSLAQKKNDIYRAYLSELSEKSILPGVVDLIETLKLNDIKIGIGSSSKNANLILNQVGLINQFDTIVDGSMVKNSKPEPDIFLLGAKKLNIKPEACLVIEDAAAGVLAAKAANMLCVGVGTENQLHEADLIVSNLTQLSMEKINSLFHNNQKTEIA